MHLFSHVSYCGISLLFTRCSCCGSICYVNLVFGADNGSQDKSRDVARDTVTDTGSENIGETRKEEER